MAARIIHEKLCIWNRLYNKIVQPTETLYNSRGIYIDIATGLSRIPNSLATQDEGHLLSSREEV